MFTQQKGVCVCVANCTSMHAHSCYISINFDDESAANSYIVTLLHVDVLTNIFLLFTTGIVSKGCHHECIGSRSPVSREMGRGRGGTF